MICVPLLHNIPNFSGFTDGDCGSVHYGEGYNLYFQMMVMVLSCGCCGKVFLFLHFCWVMWLILSKKFYLTGLNMNVFSIALIILLIVLLWFPTLTSIIYDSIEIVQFKYKINRPFFDMVQNLCHNYIIC